MAILYAAKGGPSTASDLYTIDPVTGIGTSIGAIGYAVTGLCFDPTTGILYGVTSLNSAASPSSIITINIVTGAGTLVGAVGLACTLGDIAFDSAGNLYGFETCDHTLVVVNKSTGAGTEPDSLVDFFPHAGFGCSIDGTDQLWVFPSRSNGDFWTVDKVTAAKTLQGTLDDPADKPVAAASFDGAGVLWAVIDPSGTHKLATIDLTTGVVTFGPTVALNIDAITWDEAPGGGGGGLTADFSAAPLTGDAPLAVAFTDLSTGGPVSWAWDFGDGGTDTVQNPTHIYVTDGSYDVTLTVA
jgi:hypothetical protein